MNPRSSRTTMAMTGCRSVLPSAWRQGRRSLLLLAFLAMPLGTGAEAAPGLVQGFAPPLMGPAPMAGPYGRSVVRTYAYPNWVAPSHLATPAGPAGIHAAAELPGLPGTASLGAVVTDHYDWLPPLGVNGFHDRPWLQVGGEWSLQRTRARPFLGIGASLPLVSAGSGLASQDLPAANAAARGQIGIYAGVRF